MERLWPALEHIDTSSGALGSAVYKTLDTLIPIIIEAPADDKTRNKWLDRLWQAIIRTPPTLHSRSIIGIIVDNE